MSSDRPILAKILRVLSGFATAILLVFVAWRTVWMVFIMPLAAGPDLKAYLPYIAEILLALTSIALSIVKRHVLAFLVASALTAAAAAYWWFVVCGDTPIWSDFRWLVVPEFVFVSAVLVRWLAESDNTGFPLFNSARRLKTCNPKKNQRPTLTGAETLWAILVGEDFTTYPSTLRRQTALVMLNEDLCISPLLLP
jgi:hypothetical protein